MDQVQRLTKPVLAVSAFGFLLVSLFVHPPNVVFVKQPWFKILIGSIVIALVFVEPVAGLLLGVALAIVLLRVHQYELYRVMDMVDDKGPVPEPASVDTEASSAGVRFAHTGDDLLPPPIPVTPTIQIPDKDAFISREWLEKAQNNTVSKDADTDIPFAALTKTDQTIRGLPQQPFEWYETIA